MQGDIVLLRPGKTDSKSGSAYLSLGQLKPIFSYVKHIVAVNADSKNSQDCTYHCKDNRGALLMK